MTSQSAILLLAALASIASTSLAAPAGGPASASASSGAPGPATSAQADLAPADWAAIRATRSAGRHALRQVDGEWRARNQAQRFLARFDGRGFTVAPDGGEWSFGLELASWGFPSSERSSELPDEVRADGARITYAWDDLLLEWYVNDGRGLEHGYTVRHRPSSGERGERQSLCFRLAVRGGLEPQAIAGGRGARFMDADGREVLSYTGLVAFDADGNDLPAWMEIAPTALLLCVDERGARYPVTIDPLVQQAYLKASNAEAEDHFGYAVASSGDTVVVGAPGEDSGAQGVDGDPSDNSVSQAGAVYVFVRDGAAWVQQAYLKASNTGNGGHFGNSVAVSGDIVVVGTPWENSGSKDVDGDQDDTSAPSSGAAYVFVRSGASWSQEAYLKASNTGAGDGFGSAVAVFGDTIVVGAPNEDSAATGVDGDSSNDGAPQSGAAYVFVRRGTSWSRQAYLKASNTGQDDTFGSAVAISGDTLVIGAWREDSSATGVDGDQSDNGTFNAGAAYVFARAGGTWTQEAYLKASNTGFDDRFGFAVAAHRNLVAVGAVNEDSSATGVDGDQTSDATVNSGAVYLFARSGASWSQTAYVKASNTGPGDWFGHSVALSGNLLVVGAPLEDGSATGVDGDQASNGAPNSGAAYMFVRSGAGWSQAAYLKASNTGTSDLFGHALAASDGTIVVGAWQEDSSGAGVNADQHDDGASNAGVAYVLGRPMPVGDAYCFCSVGSGPCNGNDDPSAGCANLGTGRGGLLEATGSTSVAADTIAFLALDLPDQVAMLYAGDTALGGGGVVFGDGLRCAGGALRRLGVSVGPAHAWGPGLAPTGAWSAGDTRYFQVWYRDPSPASCSGHNTTNGVEITFTH